MAKMRTSDFGYVSLDLHLLKHRSRGVGVTVTFFKTLKK